MSNIEFINNGQVYTPDFTIGERIGRGGFGSIYKVTGNFNTPAVIKIPQRLYSLPLAGYI